MAGLRARGEGGAAPEVEAATAVAGGLPVVFGACAGFLHPGTARRGVLMAAGIGYEAHCVSQTWCALAGSIAARGLPVLRFDYPGSFDSLGDHDTPDLVAGWSRSLAEAARTLTAAAAVDEIVIVAFGFGAALAVRALPEIGNVTALALLAPVLSGREQAREMTVTARIADEYLGVPQDVPEGALSVAGFRFSAETLGAMKAMKTPTAPLPTVRRVLVLDKPGRTTAETLAPLLGPDTTLTTTGFEAYATLTFDPTAARPPADVLAAVADFAADGLVAPSVTVPVAHPYAVLPGDGFLEEGIRFGDRHCLFGVLTLPASGVADRAVIILNTGRSRHTGWARAAVEQARALAGAGIATFRIDTRAIGDGLPLQLPETGAISRRPDESVKSGSAPDAAEVLYEDSVAADVSAALAVLAERGFPSAIVCGGCSGAFLAFATAAVDPRIDGLVLVNPQRLVWHPGEDLAVLMKEGTRTVKGQAGQALSLRQWRRLLAGELAVGRIARAIARQLAAIVIGRLVRRGLPVSSLARVRAEILRRLTVLDGRGAPVAFVYGEEDRGREALALYFGPDFKGLAAFSRLTVRILAGTDHNMTPLAARAAVTDEILRLAGRTGQAASGPVAADPVNPAEAGAMLREGPAAA